MRRGRVLLGAVAIVAVATALGPRPSFDPSWREPELPADLDAYVAAGEADVANLRPGDERAIVWADSAVRARTPLALVYLHGYSADRHEIEPVVTELGAALGANVYFARLTGHGRDGEAMAEATVEDWLADTAEAIAIGARIGERVVTIGTSTGATLAVWAASRPESEGRVAAMVLVSPNFHPVDRSSRVLLMPWGALVARVVVGPERCWTPANEGQGRHWTTCYPTRALVPMMALVEHVRALDLGTLETPTLVVYATEDEVVDASETERAIAVMPNVRTHRVASSTDPSHHVLAGDILSPGTNDEVRTEMLRFLRAFLPAHVPQPPPS